MTKATMPEPVAWRTGIDLFRTESAAHLNLRNPDLTPEPLITTTQAEAYADAVTREATAQASEALGLVHNSSQAALAARNKYEMRRLFAAGGVASPRFKLYEAVDNPAQIAAEIRYPCVVKPLLLSGSRGGYARQ